MSGERMRRVDEAIREVLGDAVAQDLKDPRVGFVTVTDVKTSPDLRHARVFVSVLGDDAEQRADARRAALRARLPAARASPASCASSARRRSTFAYDDTTERALRARADRSHDEEPSAREHRSSTPARGDARGRSSRDPHGGPLRARHPREPRRRRARLARRHARRALRARQGLGHVHGRERVPAARTSTASSTSTACVAAPPDDVDERTVVFLDCGNIDRNPVDGAQAATTPHPQHRPPPRQHALRHGQPRRRRTRRARPRSSGT